MQPKSNSVWIKNHFLKIDNLFYEKVWSSFFNEATAASSNMGQAESNESAAVKRQAEAMGNPMYALLDLGGKLIRISASIFGTKSVIFWILEILPQDFYLMLQYFFEPNC